jgi:hypothetical protein
LPLQWVYMVLHPSNYCTHTEAFTYSWAMSKSCLVYPISPDSNHFRSCLSTLASHTAASSSRSSLHTSAVLNVRLTSKQARHEKASKVQARINLKLAFDTQREYAVLGHCLGQGYKWRDCDLANAITDAMLYSEILLSLRSFFLPKMTLSLGCIL